MQRYHDLALALGCAACVALPLAASAQTSPATDPTSTDERLRRLEQRQQQLEDELKQKDAEIQSLKKQQAAAPQGAAVAPAVVAALSKVGARSSVGSEAACGGSQRFSNCTRRPMFFFRAEDDWLPW